MVDSDRFEVFGNRSSDGPSSFNWKKPLLILALVGVILGFPAACTALMSGGDDSPRSSGSLGEAEVACERAIESQMGSSPDVSYATETDRGDGAFTLYGEVTSDYSAGKFTCKVTGARGDGTGSATVEIYE
ncbi:hypothetical protein ACMZ29_15315 [Brevibacterium casei]|uniref:hypothetical protein n=1 Tax=Brevibacterium casei TaxID=33889 RepID=UPI0039EFC9C5